MSRIVVLGGCGAVGRVAARTLALYGSSDEVVLADLDLVTAEALAAELVATPAKSFVSAVKVDASNVASVRAVVSGATVALNCVGPFFKFARPVLQACIDERVNYVDICDDVDATDDLFSMNDAVKAAGINALIGMGNSPGLTNIFARLAADVFLDEVQSIDICHCHGGEAFEGPGVVAHRLHGMGMSIPVFVNGELKQVGFFKEDGIALQGEAEFHLIGKEKVYPYPHPEQVTVPQHIKCKNVVNRGTVLPQPYFDLTVEVARELNAHSSGPLKVGDVEVQRDNAISWLLEQRDRLLKEMNFGTQRGCMHVQVSGFQGSQPASFVFSTASVGGALGEGTGIPAALGAILMQKGKVKGPGVVPPEAGVGVFSLLSLADPVLKVTKQMEGKGNNGEFPISLHRVSPDGTRELLKLNKGTLLRFYFAKKFRQGCLKFLGSLAAACCGNCLS